MHKVILSKQKSHQLAEWSSNDEHLDALDCELALINCSKIWIDAGTAGITPRSAMIQNRDLQLKKSATSAGNSPSTSPRSNPESQQQGAGASIFVYTTKQLKKLSRVDKLRHEFIQQSCRNFALQIRGLKTGLKEDLEALNQSVIEERPLPLPKQPPHDNFLLSVVEDTDDQENDTIEMDQQEFYDEEGFNEEGFTEEGFTEEGFTEEGRNEEGRNEEEDMDEEDRRLMLEESDLYGTSLLPDGWDINMPSPREHPFGRSRQQQQSTTRYLPPLTATLTATSAHVSSATGNGTVTISKYGPFGGRSSGLLLRPSIISMNPTNRLQHIRKVLPGIVESISNTIVDQAIHETSHKNRLRPIPHLSSRASKTFSTTFDAVVTKQREAISKLATSQICDIMQKLRKELNTVKQVQSSLGQQWMMLIAFVNRTSHLSHTLSSWRTEDELNRAAMKIQNAIRDAKSREMAVKTKPVRDLLSRNIWVFVLRLKVKMRKRSARLVKKFVRDYVGGVGIKNIIYKFRWKVIRTQQTVRSFLACKKARMIALHLFWDREEKKTDAQNELRALRRSVLAHQGGGMEEDDSATTDEDPNGKSTVVYEADIKTLERAAAMTMLTSTFHNRFLKTNSILLSAKQKYIGNSAAAQELDNLGKWTKWRGGFARVCSKDVMRDLLEPWLFKKRRIFESIKRAKAAKETEGLGTEDMKRFMQGESWEDLMASLKPKPATWMLFTELSRGQDMGKLIEAGLVEQMKIDEEMEIQKMQLL